MNESTAASDAPGAKPAGGARSGVRAHLVKVIPTDRVNFDKQAAALRAYAAASGREKKAVTNDEVAAVMSELAASSISLCNPFFSDVGLLAQEGRKLRPVDAVFDLQHAHEWKPETAGLKLGPIFSEHWSAKILVPKLAFRQLSKEEAIAFLAEESKATTGNRKSLETLLDFLNFAGVIRLDGNAVLKANAAPAKAQEVKNQDPPPPPPPKDPLTDLTLDPMILGLFKKLPAADTEWAIADRVKWLRTAANIFDLVYQAGNAPGEVKISQKTEEPPS